MRARYAALSRAVLRRAGRPAGEPVEVLERLHSDWQRDVEQARSFIGEIANGLGEGFLAIDRSRRIVLANARLGELLRQPVSTGGSMLELVRQPQLIAALDRSVAGNAATARALVGLSGAERAIELRAFPVTASREIAAVGLFLDVTEIERLENVRREFVSDFSHEIRTPLAGLRSAVESLESGPLDPQQERHLREIVARQLRRIDRLVADLGELNEIETGELVLSNEPTDLRRLLEQVAEDFRERAVQTRTTVTVSGPSVVADVDPVRIAQVFTNLLDNALKHGGSDQTISVTLAERDASIVTTVRDNGPGIPPGELERIFRRFYRVDKSRSQPGSGIGLAIVKHLVRMHRGTVAARNAHGGGAEFVVTLPLKTHR